jgi:hypothetical protein
LHGVEPESCAYAVLVDRAPALDRFGFAELQQTIRVQTWAFTTALVTALAVFATIFGVLARP